MQGGVRSLPKALEGEEGKEPHRSVHEGLDWKWFFVNALWGDMTTWVCKVTLGLH